MIFSNPQSDLSHATPIVIVCEGLVVAVCSIALAIKGHDPLMLIAAFMGWW